jgi:hypothetical protein
MMDNKKTFKVTRTLVLVLVCLLSCEINAQPILYVENPEYHGHYNAFTCLSVRLTNNKTILTHRFKASNISNSFWVYKGCYLQTFDSSRKYNLLYVKNASFDKYNTKKINDYSDFTQVFEPLPANCTRFKYYEPDGRYETYDLNNYTGRKIVYSDNRCSYTFKRVANAFSQIFSDNQNVVKVCRENGEFLSKIRKMEVSLNYPIITLVYRFGDSSYEGAYEFRFNVNDVQIEEYAIDNGKRFYVINSGSGIVYNNLATYYDREDYINGNSDNCKYIFFNSDYPILNRRIGNALLALLKAARDPNADVPIDFDKAPSGMSFKNMVRNKTKSTSNNGSIKNGAAKRSTNRVPTLRKTK